MEKLKSVLYARVSTDKEEQDQSYIQQQKFNDDRFNIVKVFDDRSTGTSIKKRTGFLKMLEYCNIETEFIGSDYIFKIIAPSDIQVIIVSNTSRFGRNLIDVKRSLDILHRQGIKVYFNDIKAYSDNEQLEILLNIYFTIDQQYSKDLSRKSKAGIDRLRRNENHVFCTGGIKGYNLKGGKLTKNEDAKKIYNIFYDYVYNNLSSVKLAEKYNFKSSTIRSILNNSKYYGYDKYIDKINPNIEPIISKELYDKAQEIRLSRNNGARGKNTNTYPLSSKIICPYCGCKYSCKKTKTKKIWSCQSSPTRNGLVCNSGGISENRINKYMKNTLLNGEYEKEITILIDRKLNDLQQINTICLKADIKRIDNQLDTLLDLLLNNQIDKKRYINKQKELEEEKQELLLKLEYANNQNKKIEEIEELYNTYMDKIEYLKSLALDNNFDELQKNVKNIYLHNKGFGIYEGLPTQINKIVFKELDILE
ncbi:recombinase family protein [Clostridium celatum]|uniref:recombinase family protein n=1 Tax=Clostridium celatum TaxID=36834 RepID=UPI0028FDE0F9|nr:recombinase family protein [Clostridium celatum]MDU2265460.1 recombinase family protein [Clostridium celatum]MDU6295190.1 recombinase family protein [Clostridium celatum]